MERKLLQITSSINTLIKLDFSDLSNRQMFVCIEEDLSDLKKKIYNQKTTNTNRIYEENIKILKNNYLILYGEMLQIKNEIIALGNNLDSAIEAVKEYRFPEAENILESVGNSSLVIQNLVHAIYADNRGNARLLMDFAREISTIDLSLKLLLSIYNEMKSHGDLDVFRWLDFIRVIESGVFNQTDFNPINYPDAVSLHKNILASLKNNATDMMASVMINHTCKTNKNVQHFFMKLDSLNASLSNEILFETIDKVYYKISNKEIIDKIYCQYSSEQKKSLLVYMYKKMQKFNELDSALLKLAEYTSEILDLEYFRKGLEGNRDNALVTVWDELPVSVRNLYTTNCVYLKEATNSEYLYAASDGFTNGGNRRYMFTWIPRQMPTQGVWFVEHDF